MNKCFYCRNDYVRETDEMLCSSCISLGRRLTPVACHGCSDGPGSGRTQQHFNQPDAKKDIMLTAKRLEESGTLRDNPEMKKYCDIKVAAAKAMPDTSGIDYGKTGHPIEQ